MVALSRKPDDPPTGGRFGAGRFVVMLDRGDYWQCAFVIAKGDAERIVQDGSPPSASASRRRAVPRRPRRRADTWDDVKLLTVSIDRLRAGTGRACSASATPPTPCRRSAASASISRSRMPSRRPTSWGSRWEWHADDRRPCASAATAHLPDARDAAPAGAGPEPHRAARAARRRTDDAALGRAHVRPASMVAADPGAHRRRRGTARAHQVASVASGCLICLLIPIRHPVREG